MRWFIAMAMVFMWGCGASPPTLGDKERMIQRIANVVFYTHEGFLATVKDPSEIEPGVADIIRYSVEEKGIGVRRLFEGIRDGSSPLAQVADQLSIRIKSGMEAQGSGGDMLIALMACGWARELWNQVAGQLSHYSKNNRYKAIDISFDALVNYADYLDRRYRNEDPYGYRYRMMEDALLGWLCLANHLNEKGFMGNPGSSTVIEMALPFLPEVVEVLKSAVEYAADDTTDVIVHYIYEGEAE